MAHEPEHDWLVVAPWWNWGKPPSTAQGRLSRPLLQKYDNSDLVNAFLADPQRRLAFVEDDLVQVSSLLAPVPPGADGLPRRLSDAISVPQQPRTRKIFLNSHKRFYLVVCQVNCDSPSLPQVARDRICECRFVVRRRTTDVPAASVKQAVAVLKDLKTARLQGQKLDRAWVALHAKTKGGAETAFKLRQAKVSALREKRASVQARIQAERQRLSSLSRRFGIVPKPQGWFKATSGAEGIGFWGDVEDTPDELGDEQSFPMYPLIPPDSDTKHDGRFGTIYFGILPTGSSDLTVDGHSRFDDRAHYEVRCFVKRHKRWHTAGDPCPCPDRMFWSAASEVYRLAAHFDLTGTSQRPVSIQLPDLKALEAQATPALGALFVKPEGSLMIAGNASGGVNAGGRSQFEICSIPIPLITIVAMFVFELFLPVVMLLFGLFWMLKLKFCIPPQVEVAAGLNAELAVDGPDLSFSAAASVKAGFAGAFGFEIPEGDPLPPTPTGIPSELAQKLGDNYSPIALHNLAFKAQEAAAQVETHGLETPGIGSNLVWVERVEFQ